MKDIVVSFSGGRSSAMMCYILENDPKYRQAKKHYVFANTGRELDYTLMFINDVSWLFDIKVHYIEAEVNHHERKSTGFKIVENRGDLSINGEPFKEVVEKYGLPNVSFPHCTRELKINPINAFIKDFLGLSKGEYLQAIGMRFDEPRRVKPNPEFIYPLYDNKVTKQDVTDFWEHPDRRTFNLALEEFEGNCDFCFKKSWNKLKMMAKKHPHRLLWWNDLERKYGSNTEDVKSNLYRGHKLAIGIRIELEQDEKDLECACSFN